MVRTEFTTNLDSTEDNNPQHNLEPNVDIFSVVPYINPEMTVAVSKKFDELMTFSFAQQYQEDFSLQEDTQDLALVAKDGFRNAYTGDIEKAIQWNTNVRRHKHQIGKSLLEYNKKIIADLIKEYTQEATKSLNPEEISQLAAINVFDPIAMQISIAEQILAKLQQVLTANSASKLYLLQEEMQDQLSNILLELVGFYSVKKPILDKQHQILEHLRFQGDYFTFQNIAEDIKELSQGLSGTTVAVKPPINRSLFIHNMALEAKDIYAEIISYEVNNDIAPNQLDIQGKIENIIQQLSTEISSLENDLQEIEEDLKDLAQQQLDPTSIEMAAIDELKMPDLARKQYNIASYYMCGNNGFVKNIHKAIEWYEKAANQGDIGSQNTLGSIYLNGNSGISKDIAKAISWYEKAANQGNTGSQNALGNIYLRVDSGISRDVAKAISWHEKAANQNYTASQSMLGDIYSRDEYLVKNATLAFSWYEKAAANVTVYSASLKLAGLYLDGTGVAKNRAKAVEIYLQLANRGIIHSQFFTLSQAEQQQVTTSEGKYQVANFYRNGHSGHGGSIDKNITLAIDWYEEAFNCGKLEAAACLAAIYATGKEGVPKDEAKALQWYLKAVEKNYHQALLNLGQIYEQGLGVPKNQATAIEYYLKAAENSILNNKFFELPPDKQTVISASGQCNIAQCYATGRFVAKDETKAIYWYEKAANQDYVQAKSALASIRKQKESLEQAELCAQKKASLQSEKSQQNTLLAEKQADLKKMQPILEKICRFQSQLETLKKEQHNYSDYIQLEQVMVLFDKFKDQMNKLELISKDLQELQYKLKQANIIKQQESYLRKMSWIQGSYPKYAIATQIEQLNKIKDHIDNLIKQPNIGEVDYSVLATIEIETAKLICQEMHDQIQQAHVAQQDFLENGNLTENDLKNTIYHNYYVQLAAINEQKQKIVNLEKYFSDRSKKINAPKQTNVADSSDEEIDDDQSLATEKNKTRDLLGIINHYTTRIMQKDLNLNEFNNAFDSEVQKISKQIKDLFIHKKEQATAFSVLSVLADEFTNNHELKLMFNAHLANFKEQDLLQLPPLTNIDQIGIFLAALSTSQLNCLKNWINSIRALCLMNVEAFGNNKDLIEHYDKILVARSKKPTTDPELIALHQELDAKLEVNDQLFKSGGSGLVKLKNNLVWLDKMLSVCDEICLLRKDTAEILGSKLLAGFSQQIIRQSHVEVELFSQESKLSYLSEADLSTALKAYTFTMLDEEVEHDATNIWEKLAIKIQLNKLQQQCKKMIADRKLWLIKQQKLLLEFKEMDFEECEPYIIKLTQAHELLTNDLQTLNMLSKEINHNCEFCYRQLGMYLRGQPFLYLSQEMLLQLNNLDNTWNIKKYKIFNIRFDKLKNFIIKDLIKCRKLLQFFHGKQEVTAEIDHLQQNIKYLTQASDLLLNLESKLEKLKIRIDQDHTEIKIPASGDSSLKSSSIRGDFLYEDSLMEHRKCYPNAELETFLNAYKSTIQQEYEQSRSICQDTVDACRDQIEEDIQLQANRLRDNLHKAYEQHQVEFSKRDLLFKKSTARLGLCAWVDLNGKMATHITPKQKQQNDGVLERNFCKKLLT